MLWYSGLNDQLQCCIPYERWINSLLLQFWFSSLAIHPRRRRRRLKCLCSTTHMEHRHEAPESWLQIGPILAVTAIWEVSQQVKYLSLFSLPLSLYLCNSAFDFQINKSDIYIYVYTCTNKEAKSQCHIFSLITPQCEWRERIIGMSKINESKEKIILNILDTWN